MASLMSPLCGHGGSAVYCTQKHQHLSIRLSTSLPLPRSQVIALSLQKSMDNILVDFSGKKTRFFGLSPLLRQRGSVHMPVIKASAAEAELAIADFIRHLVTGFVFLVMWYVYVLYIRSTAGVYQYFPFPFFISAVHLLVSVTCYFNSWSLGLLQVSPISMDLLRVVTPAAVCHAVGHVLFNVSIVAHMVSSAQSVRALEPLITAAGSQFVLSHRIPLPLWTSLAPVVIGVSMILLTEYPFSQIVLTSELIATISFSFRNILLKRAMIDLDSRNVHAYMSIVALLLCLPAAIFIDGPKLLQYEFKDAIAKEGMVRFISKICLRGMFYHLFSKVAITTLERVSPLTQSVANIMVRVFFLAVVSSGGKEITTLSKIGAGIAIYGVLVYSYNRIKLG